jgi:hypothetical protein
MNASSLLCAIRGPVMLIVLGGLFALDHMSVADFERTWPLLIIVFGVLKLLERVMAAEPPAPPYPGTPPYTGGPQQ